MKWQLAQGRQSCASRGKARCVVVARLVTQSRWHFNQFAKKRSRIVFHWELIRSLHYFALVLFFSCQIPHQPPKIVLHTLHSCPLAHVESALHLPGGCRVTVCLQPAKRILKVCRRSMLLKTSRQLAAFFVHTCSQIYFEICKDSSCFLTGTRKPT